MRCARCDRPAVPQAVGFLPRGRVVFGWCLDCLDEAGCSKVVAARPVRTPSTRLVLEDVTRESYHRPAPEFLERRRRDAASLLEDRRKLVGAVALLMGLWGTALFFVGVCYQILAAPAPGSPFGNGSPALLLGGGGATAAVGITLWLLASGRDVARSGPALRAVQAAGLIVALLTVLVGLLVRSPRRQPLVAGIASAGITITAAARWVESRLASARGRR